MTRARSQLLLSAVQPHQRPDTTSWWARLCPLVPPWQPPENVDAAPEVPSNPVLRELPPWQPSLATPAATSHAAADRPEQARLGEALHRVLEWAGAVPAPDLPALAAAAASEFGLPPPAHPELLRLARTVWGSAPVRRFFDPARLAWSGNEVTLLDGEAILRLDRLVAVEEGAARTWWVLDYKLQPAPHTVPAYVEQLRRYRARVQALQPADGVRAAFITSAGDVIEP